MWQIDIAADVRLELGESVLWDDQTGRLAWVNIHRAELWELEAGGQLRQRALPDRVGAIAMRRHSPGYVAGLAKKFAFFDPNTGRSQLIAPVEADVGHTRLNDGRADPFGNFLCGGMNEGDANLPGSHLYRLRPDRVVEVLLSGVGCANSTCFSPDGKTLYFADMHKARIMAYPYDPDGLLGPGQLFYDFDGRTGLPDGSTVDAEGFLWNAHWGAACLTRHTPDGRIDQEISLPVTNPTCLAFGGPDMTTLFVSTARFQLTPEQLEREPLAGAVLKIETNFKGLPEPRFAG